MDSVLETVTQPGIIPMIGFAIGLYVITGALKTIAVSIGGRTEKILCTYQSIIPVVIGVIAGPFIVPYLLAEFGSKQDVPLAASIFTGVAAGGLSKILWDTINRVIKRLVKSDGS